MRRLAVNPSWVVARQRGQTLMEFGLILVAVAVPGITFLVLFGDRVWTLFDTITGSVP